MSIMAAKYSHNLARNSKENTITLHLNISSSILPSKCDFLNGLNTNVVTLD